jgi:hypothetical protein
MIAEEYEDTEQWTKQKEKQTYRPKAQGLCKWT